MAYISSPFYRDDDRQFLGRDKTMSLDIVRPDDIPRGKVRFIKEEDKSLTTEDISRARPTYPHLQFLDKPDLSKGCTDPEHVGARARTYYPPMDRRPRDLSLTTADIEYAQPKKVNYRGNRHTDPVCPNYELPSCHVRPVTPPRWNGRHHMDNSDIELSHPKVLAPERNYVRDPNDASDIEFACPAYQERVKRPPNPNRLDRSMNVRDITDVNDSLNPKRVMTRCTNPMNPTYRVSTSGGTSLHTKFNEEKGFAFDLPEMQMHIGEVHGSKPRKLQWDNSEPQLSLVREDIAGAAPQRFVGSVPFNIYDPPEVKPMLSRHDPHDIPGAQVGTLRKGIVSGRTGTTNPLNPRYVPLDGIIRPDAVPVIAAERGDAQLHPIMKGRYAGGGSLPNLVQPDPTLAGGSLLPRDASTGALQSGGRQSRASSIAGSTARMG
mmetsp:Transcript_33318/g.61084  ORF Transcript_33318/g.61084 Transcript_33318/m.61084 type:complete len:435 (-) Transcript_33318:69-1373(-)